VPLVRRAIRHLDEKTRAATAGIVFDGDEGRLSEMAFLRDFAGDLPEAKARVLYAVQEPFHKALLTGKTTHAAWRSKPSYYAVSTDDRTINPDLERFMAKRMRAKTIEVKASHLSLISHPDEITPYVELTSSLRGRGSNIFEQPDIFGDRVILEPGEEAFRYRPQRRLAIFSRA
jgi:pimeloyl-ACP methyl ester carboxylesterase